MAYQHFKADDGSTYGSFEVFHMSAREARAFQCQDGGNCTGAGWYWHACFPGCLPDGDPFGPFPSERAATVNAQDEG